jgi:hypothetical protein
VQTRRILVAALATLVTASCGNDPTDERGPAVQREPEATARERVVHRSAEPCKRAIRVEDPAGDTEPASADLQVFELHASAAGVCTRFTTAARPTPGSKLVLVAHGPFTRMPGGAIVSHGHGFDVELLESGPRVTYGLDRLGSDAPRVLRARVGQSGRTVSAFVPRSELDRAPANMPQRPRFPFRAFFIEARAVAPPDSRGSMDSWPDTNDGRAAYIGGRLCRAPCKDRRIGFDVVRQGPQVTPSSQSG